MTTPPALKRLLCSEYYALNALIVLSYALWLRRTALDTHVAASPLSWLTGSAVTAPYTAVCARARVCARVLCAYVCV